MRKGTLPRLVLSLVAGFAAMTLQPAATIEAPRAHAAPISPSLPAPRDWQTLTHDDQGFKIAYPSNVFMPTTGPSPDAGRVLVSPDGLAKLMIAAFDNETGASLADYRRHVLETSYAGSDIDYAPVRKSWFVLSGTRNGTIFYERVSFTCRGRRITSWAMLYPHEQRHYYNPILESIARTFRPSRTSDGC